MSGMSNGLPLLTNSLSFAAKKHKLQKRKDGVTPYINHPIEVMQILATVAGVQDCEVLAAAALHDTIEDTQTTAEELREAFGERVLSLVLECTDDKTLPKAERKRLQVEHAPHKSADAKLIKIADKISNMRDIVASPPTEWDEERKDKYLEWGNSVFAGLKGANAKLDELFEATLESSRTALASQKQTAR
jgi:guanosine-3',5'-bis(diphosphate) 3'-pyrophosphohydrolase